MTVEPTWKAGETADAPRLQAMAGLVTSWTPSLITDGAGADPTTSGAGEIKAGLYSQQGNWIDATCQIKFGASAAAGSGTYQITNLPAQFDSALAGGQVRIVVGHGHAIDQSVPAIFVCQVVWGSGVNDKFNLVADASVNFGNASPMVWAVDDQLVLNLRYPALWS